MERRVHWTRALARLEALEDKVKELETGSAEPSGKPESSGN